MIPDRVDRGRQLPLRPRPVPGRAEARLHSLCDGEHRELAIDSNAPSAPVPDPPVRAAAHRSRLLEVAPKQAWTPVAEFALAGVDAVNFGPGDPRSPTAATSRSRVAALVRSYRTLEAFLCG